MATISRAGYAEMFGPTVGDRVRLADTGLLVEVEDDYTLRAGGYGEEVKFGGGKTIRDGMGQGQRVSAEVADTVVTNALVIDHWGIVKADVAIKLQRRIGLEKMEVRADLDRPVATVGDDHGGGAAPDIKGDLARFDQHFTWDHGGL